MKTKSHWESCKNLASYYAAKRLGLHLMEVARQQGYNPRGVKILDKEQAYAKGLYSDSAVVWTEGPKNWARLIDIKDVPGVCFEASGTATITFYDIVLPMASGQY